MAARGSIRLFAEKVKQIGLQFTMKVPITYWQEKDGMFLGFLNEFPDHWTQGETMDDLMEHLKDLHSTFTAETLPGIRRVTELEVA